MNFKNLTALILLTIMFGCSEQELLPQKQWFKGNLHTHSYWSDGDEFPEVIMDWYKSNDYQFVALTDHNILAEGDKSVFIRPDSIYQNAFKNYLEKYGPNWVNYKLDTFEQIFVKLKTYEEYRGQFEEEDKFLIIQSEEISAHFDDKPLHLNAHNIQKKIHPRVGESVVEVLQNNIDEVMRQREALNVPMLVHINHPNFRHAISLEDMIALRNERFFEVYNGHHLVNNSGDSTHMSTEKMWDLINIAYIEDNKPLMYGLATDDSHHYHVKGREWSNAGRGWVVVQADSLSKEALIESMEAGAFYASTGVELQNVTLENNELSVEVKEEAGITYQISFIGYKKGNTESEEFISVEGNKASFKLTDDIFFVRSKITSSKLHPNPIEDLIYETAWTQPMKTKTVINK